MKKSNITQENPFKMKYVFKFKQVIYENKEFITSNHLISFNTPVIRNF